MRTVDLFCGCGGMSLGFQNAGFEIVAAYDNWAPAIAVYRDNFDHEVHDIDLGSEAAVAHIAGYAPDICIGGAPCQDFSLAGKQEQGERANLTISFANIIAVVRPKLFVMENVHNIEKAGAAALTEVRRIFTTAGYFLHECVLDASKYEVPQARKRFFMIGGFDEAFIRSVGQRLTAAASKKQTTVRDYLGESLGIEFYYRHPRTYGRRAVYSIDEPSATIRGVNRPIPPTYKAHDGDKADALSSVVRILTAKERSLIQTFPPSFKFCEDKSRKISKSALEQMIGNAVPVKLAEAVAKQLIY